MTARTARMPASRTLCLCLATLAALGSGLASAAAAIEVPRGDFRVSRGIAAPWLEPAQAAPDTRAWLGARVEFAARRFAAPAGLGCDDAVYQTDWRPAEGLFQGGLPSPAAQAAARLALVSLPVPSVDLTCSTGVFDLHWATQDALMLAIDNVIWVLDRSPGALAAHGAPEGAVQRLLEAHFAGDMGFDADSVAAKRDWLEPSLQAAIADYFATPRPADEAPPINGDPFTDSQEYPVMFSVRAAGSRGTQQAVPVRFDDGYRARTVVFLLARSGDGWRLDDLQYEHGGSLRQGLAEHRGAD
jgi:hypothetical protein